MVDIDKSIDVTQLNTGCRVALRADSYTLHKILPNKVHCLFSCLLFTVSLLGRSTSEFDDGGKGSRLNL